MHQTCLCVRYLLTSTQDLYDQVDTVNRCKKTGLDLPYFHLIF